MLLRCKYELEWSEHRSFMGTHRCQLVRQCIIFKIRLSAHPEMRMISLCAQHIQY